MIDPMIAAFQVNCSAMTYAMQTASQGEDVEQIISRARRIAAFMMEPLKGAQISAEIGEPESATLN